MSSVLTTAPISSASYPNWFNERQQAAWQKFLLISPPKRGDEMWRFSNVKTLDFSEFSQSPQAFDAQKCIEKSVSLESPVAKLVFVNERLVAQQSQLPEGVICLPLAEAIEVHSELVQQYFMQKTTRLGSEKWTALHEAKVSNGLFVFVPEGVEIEGTIEVFHWVAGHQVAVFPHTLIIAAAKSAVRVVDYFQSVDESSVSLTIAVNDLIAGEGAKLDYLTIQNLNDVSKVIQVNETSVAKQATTTGFILNTGGAWVRNESLCQLLGEEARSNMLSVNLPSAQQECDQRTFQHHVSSGAFSDLLYKNSLYDQAKTVFSGLIFVDEGAHRTDAYQTCRNLFMSDSAEANSMPGLEINADDVKCSHGSTSCSVSEEEIFYLRARGISSDTARQLIARGFSVEVVERLGDDAVENMVIGFMDAKFAIITSQVPSISLKTA